jgi:O-antigen/teichoic acid export membrane protein
MPKNQSSYRQIMKATSLFGGVQVFTILIAIIRSKFIALLLGPAGMGIAGLLNSTIGLISALTNFGLGTSAVKNVAAASASEDKTRIAIVIAVLRRWVWVTGLLGAILTIVTAPLLSHLTFGNNKYTFPFVLVSISLLLTQLSSGQIVLLQGMRKLHLLAKASLTGSIFGLIVTVPLYYIYGFRGIVPGIIGSSIITFIGSWYFARKVKIDKANISKATTFAEGKEMLSMGFMISLSGLITLGTSYIARIFISRTGSVDQVGLYTAGFAIINTYVGLVFTAMGTDYYPRLSAVANSNVLSKRLINQQAEIAILVLAPILIVFLVFIQSMILILYSNTFIAIDTMLQWAALGIFFKAASWSLSFIFLAKGVSRLFFWNELIGNIYMLVLNILGYHFMGLEGLGISFMIGYLLYLIQVFVLCRIKFQFSFYADFVRVFTIQFLLTLICFLQIRYIGKPYSYLIGGGLIVLTVWYSYKEFDRRLDVKSIVCSIRNKF